MAVEFDPTRPIYLQIMEEIKRRVVQGQYPPGAKLPSVRETASEMGVNPNTMARAYMELEREGFVATRRGEGSFVTDEAGRVEGEREALAGAARARFVAQIRQLGLTRAQVRSLLTQMGKEIENG